ncbi:MAG: pilus assembly protein TadG-related protein [Terriglobales bacterium]
MRTGEGKNEQGVIITLVAMFMLFVVGAMAALSIDVVTIYTARSEAQLAADSAALAAARVLANSGATSDPNAATDGLMANAWTLAQAVALQVAEQNQVGGVNLTSSQITIPTAPPSSVTNPTVNVKIQTNLPTFFARIWGRTQVTVAASATAEAYNPSPTGVVTSGSFYPVAPLCVKPWLLPNIDPTTGDTTIFSATTGAITNPALLGWETLAPPGNTHLKTRCPAPPGNCLPATSNIPAAWQYYPGTTDPTTGSFPAPSAASVTCTGCTGFNNYQLSIAGCVQKAISCYSSAPPSPAQIINIDTTSDANRDTETGAAVNGMTHASANGWADSIDTAVASPPSGYEPFQFVAGLGNPIPGLAGNTVMVSDSLVTVPVIDTSTWPPATFPQVQIIGFVQLFLNPYGDPSTNGHIRTEVINLVGCGTAASGPPIVGNGASPVAVRLISPP